MWGKATPRGTAPPSAPRQDRAPRFDYPDRVAGAGDLSLPCPEAHSWSARSLACRSPGCWPRWGSASPCPRTAAPSPPRARGTPCSWGSRSTTRPSCPTSSGPRTTWRSWASFAEVRLRSTTRGLARKADAPTGENLRAALRALLAKKTRHDTLLLAFAGHGVQLRGEKGGKEEAYLCPSDAQLNDPTTLVGLAPLFRDLDDCGAGAVLLLVDACRTDPKEGRNLDVSKLPRLPRGTAALFSCSPGERAFETAKLGKGHGLFFHFVLEGLRKGARDAKGEVRWDRLEKFVTEKVAREAPVLVGGGARQTPRGVNKLLGEPPVLLSRAGPLVKLPKEKEGPLPPKKVERVPPPSKERVLAARNVGAPPNVPSVLVARARGKRWARVPVKGAVYTSDEVVSLPGFTTEVLTSKGVHLTLRGSLREYAQNLLMAYLMESAVALHASDAFDLDLTLERGRVYIKNQRPKRPAKVRLRFETEVWDLALDAKAEVGVDLFRAYTRDSNYRTGEEPRCEVYLCALRGDVEVRTDAVETYNLEAPGHPAEKKPAVIAWNNFSMRVEGPGRLARVPPIWDRAPPTTPEARAATLVLGELARQMRTTPNVSRPLLELLEKEAPLRRAVALYCFTGLDDVDRLIDRLGDAQESHAPDREAAIFCLRRWLSQGPSRVKRLHDEKTGAGALVVRADGAPGYTRGEAQNILEMLFDFPDEARRNPDTFLALADKLESTKVAIAELAYWHLLRLSFPEKLPAFNAGKAIGDRKLAAEAVRRMVEGGKLPPGRAPAKKKR